ncbi:hypothetical protein JHD48_03010 [Sulfurimonas sp. SAG-AH-194-I05]|nr:hypothetical protein [Sulfurimonas sp. SAG-AH-194-I05]MDF1874702.1 hypothetical protein [Sulfurimonas sp. SAG-AH-194-I05]
MKKSLLKILVLCFFLFTALGANEYKSIDTIELKKDEHKKILVTYGKIAKLFKFRWTLYVNNGLVILRSYDRIVAQNMLYLRHKNRSFRVDLMPKGLGSIKVPYLLVKFIEFNYKTNKATFKMYLSDDTGVVTLEYLKEK